MSPPFKVGVKPHLNQDFTCRRQSHYSHHATYSINCLTCAQELAYKESSTDIPTNKTPTQDVPSLVGVAPFINISNARRINIPPWLSPTLPLTPNSKHGVRSNIAWSPEVPLRASNTALNSRTHLRNQRRRWRAQARVQAHLPKAFPQFRKPSVMSHL